MSTKLFPVQSFIVNQGNDSLGQFIGLNLGPNLIATQQGLFLGLDAAPSSGGSGAVIFDGGAPTNLRSARAIGQSPINNTKNGIVNFSSSPGVGAIGNYATISGGSGNEASQDYSTVSGGKNNECLGAYGTIVGGSDNDSAGTYGTCGGYQSSADGPYSVAEGYRGYARLYGEWSHGHGAGREGKFALEGVDTGGVPIILLTGNGLEFQIESANLIYQFSIKWLASDRNTGGAVAFEERSVIVASDSFAGAAIVSDVQVVNQLNGQPYALVVTVPSGRIVRMTFTGDGVNEIRCIAFTGWKRMSGYQSP